MRVVTLLLTVILVLAPTSVALAQSSLVPLPKRFPVFPAALVYSCGKWQASCLCCLAAEREGVKDV